LEPLQVVRASEERLDVTQQTQSAITTRRVSVASNGTQGNSDSFGPSLSADGRYVAFHSSSSNLVSGDTNNFCGLSGNFNCSDIFVHDRQTGQTIRVSVASNSTQGNDNSFGPSISADGRYVAFRSNATNIVSGDTNGIFDVFVHDRQTGQTSRVSVASDGTQADAFGSYFSSISANGRYIAFESEASNLVNSDTNGWQDIFVHDRQTGQTSRVSVASNGTQGNKGAAWPSISAEGRYVAFWSDSSNLVSGDTNGISDVFVHDRQTGQTSRVSVASNGTQGNDSSSYPSLSVDGRYVAFNSFATNLVIGDTNGKSDLFVHDRQTGQTSRVSVASNGTQGNGETAALSSISADGRYVAFVSQASNLVSGDTNGTSDVFVRDRQTDQTTRVSVTSDDTQGNNVSRDPSLSANGRSVAFGSAASNLVSGDTNGVEDVFIHFPIYYYAYLPIVFPSPTNLFIKNNTTNYVGYKVHNTPQGNIECSNRLAGATVFCGTFTAGTYSVSVSTNQCGGSSGLVTFPPGNVTREVRCLPP
jgi:Tol biopolymer transport system component